jgi:hypothetical protein
MLKKQINFISAHPKVIARILQEQYQYKLDFSSVGDHIWFHAKSCLFHVQKVYTHYRTVQL